MSQDFGRESAHTHVQTEHRKISRFLVVIDAGGVGVARLFLDSREQVAEFDSGTEEAAQMISAWCPPRAPMVPNGTARCRATARPSARAAKVYRLDV